MNRETNILKNTVELDSHHLGDEIDIWIEYKNISNFSLVFCWRIFYSCRRSNHK